MCKKIFIDLLRSYFVNCKPHCRGWYRVWSSEDKDISRSFATKRKLPQKGAGAWNQLQVIWFVGLQSRILCAFHHFYFCFYRPLLNACVILVKHTSRLQFRCVHTFQKARGAQFSLGECCHTLLICAKSSFRIKIDAAGCRQMDFKLRCRFHRLWSLNSFEVCLAHRVGLIYCSSNFLLPHNPIADQFSYLSLSFFCLGLYKYVYVSNRRNSNILMLFCFCVFWLCLYYVCLSMFVFVHMLF